MEHLKQFCARTVLSLPTVKDQGWQLKQNAILANGKNFDNNIASSAGTEAIKRLPDAVSVVKLDEQNPLLAQAVVCSI